MSRAGSSRHRAAHGGAAGGGAAACRSPLPPPLPAGFGVVIDPGTKQLEEDILFGGAPARVLRLSRTGRAALAELRAGPVRSDAAGRLARKLTDTGLAHPRPPELASPPRRHGPHPGPGPRRPARSLPVRPGGQLSGAGGGRRIGGSGRGRGRRRRARRGTGAAAGQRRPRCRPEHRPARVWPPTWWRSWTAIACPSRAGSSGSPRTWPIRRWRPRPRGWWRCRPGPAGPAATPRRPAAWTSATPRHGWCQGPGWPTCPRRRSWSGVPPSSGAPGLAASSTRRCAGVRTSTWSGGCTPRAGGSATTRRSGYPTTSPTAGRRCSRGGSATAPRRRRWRCGTLARCRRWCCTRGPR